MKLRKKNLIILAVIISAGIFAYLKFFSNPVAKSVVINQPTETATEQKLEIDNQEKVVDVKEQKNSENKTITDTKTEEDKSYPAVINKLVSWGHADTSGRKIDTIVIHSTYNALSGDPFSLDKIIDIYKSHGVSAHYLISRDGKIYRLVKDTDIAYHAGVSETPDGRTDVNNFSLGIEIINSKTAGPTENQYAALEELLKYLKGKYVIKYTLGHSQIAPGRKDDPWKLDWEKIK